MKVKAVTIVPLVLAILSILDGIATAYVLSIGVEESIPIAASAIETYGIYAILFKVLLSILPCILFHKYWHENRLARYACIFIALLYLEINVAHIRFLLTIYLN